RRVLFRSDRPVLFFNEDLDLALTLDDQAKGDGLHTSGGEAAAHLVPQQRRDLISHQAVEHATGLLRINQVAIDVAGLGKGLLHRALGNFVEGYAANALRPRLGFLLAVDGVAAEFFSQMGGDRFAFAVRVRRQEYGISRLRQLLQLGNDLLFAGNDNVFGGELVFKIDAQRLFGQIFDVAERGFHLVART